MMCGGLQLVVEVVVAQHGARPLYYCRIVQRYYWNENHVVSWAVFFPALLQHARQSLTGRIFYIAVSQWWSFKPPGHAGNPVTSGCQVVLHIEDGLHHHGAAASSQQTNPTGWLSWVVAQQASLLRTLPHSSHTVRCAYWRLCWGVCAPTYTHLAHNHVHNHTRIPLLKCVCVCVLLPPP